MIDRNVIIDVNDDEEEDGASSISKQPLLDFERMREIEEYLQGQ